VGRRAGLDTVESPVYEKKMNTTGALLCKIVNATEGIRNTPYTHERNHKSNYVQKVYQSQRSTI